ncbi:MAG: Rrf2 family transcriptional regulator [Patescibacteria group bacterium]|nr:Rrf2 family transcriptional regulator [Patescibacteria group bacterium]
MLTISTKIDYGVQMLRYLAQRDQRGGPMPLQALARQLRLPYRYLAQIARQLRQAGLLTSFEGSGGGYRLSRPPKKITLGAVVAALEPRRRLVRCLRQGHVGCPNRSHCGVRSWWQMLEARMVRQFDEITLADLP